MNNRIRDDYESVVRLVHSNQLTRYERIAQAVKTALLALALALGVWLCGEVILTSAARADAAVATSTGPVCVDYGTQQYSCE